jgi:transcriptional regulator
MYIPKHFAFDEPAQIQAFVRDFPFATLVTMVDGVPFATHLPLLLDMSTGTHGVLRGHVARPNPHWQAFDKSEAESLAIFHGPHTYVSPRWYENAPAVPTWNYIAVHMYGRPQILRSHEDLMADMTALVDHFEPDGQASHVITPEYVEKLSAGIVGFRMEVTWVEGKRKLSQNRPAEDQRGVAAALAEAEDPDAVAYRGYLEGKDWLSKT